MAWWRVVTAGMCGRGAVQCLQEKGVAARRRFLHAVECCGMGGTLLEQLEAAVEAVDAASTITPEAEREAMEAAREQAAEHGMHPKS